MRKDTSIHWIAFYTKPRTEKKVDALLQRTGFESYLPIQRRLHKWHGRKKWVKTPLLDSYIMDFA